jgi:Domain of unknown function (DUF5063)
MRAQHFSHPALTDFATIAAAFCETVENIASRTPGAQLDQIHQLLPRAYSGALQLPDTSLLFDDSAGSSEPEAESEPGTVVNTPLPGLAQLADFLGLRRFYREIFDPYADPTDGEVTGDIIDDLSDIHRDLQRGLVHWRDGRPGDALWDWRFNFQIHWGEHATSALRAIFALSAWRDVPWPTGAG